MKSVEPNSNNPSKYPCPMLKEIHALHGLVDNFSFKKFSPHYIIHEVIPKVEELQKHTYSDEIAPIQHTLEELTQLGIMLTASFAAANVFTLFLRAGTIIKAIREIHSLIVEIKKFADNTCITNVVEKDKDI